LLGSGPMRAEVTPDMKRTIQRHASRYKGNYLHAPHPHIAHEIHHEQQNQAT
jgi:hypothetical protein